MTAARTLPLPFPEHTPRVPGVEVSLRVLLRPLTVDLTTDRACDVRAGWVAPETADDFVALAAELLGGIDATVRHLRAAALYTDEAEARGARPADVALLRSVHAEACRRGRITL
jgi:hypothetical protein